MSRAKDREEFIAIMAQEDIPTLKKYLHLLEFARTLMRAEATLHRIAELECSSEAADRDRVKCPGGFESGSCLCRDYGDFDEESRQHGTVPRIAVQAEHIQVRISKLCSQHGIVPVFNRDPRGPAILLKVPSGRTNDWGQRGVCVP